MRKKKAETTLAVVCGRFFEIGYNVGLLTYIRQHPQQIHHQLDDLFIADLKDLYFKEMATHAFIKLHFTVDAQKRKIARQWFLFYMQKGFLAGLNFLQLYHQQITADADEPIELVYYQCSYTGDNSFGTSGKDEAQENREILSQLKSVGIDPRNIPLAPYQERGRFLKADTLMLFRLEDGSWRILSLDLSAFGVSPDEKLEDPNDTNILRKLLLHDAGYWRSKSIFSNLSLDTEQGSPELTFSANLASYFKAFSYRDKESSKLIQAASYAYDFYTFLLEHHALTKSTPVTLNILGYTNRSMNAITCSNENIHILEQCATIYRQGCTTEDMNEARQTVLDTIQASAEESFQDGDQLFHNLMAVSENAEDKIHWVPPHTEVIDGFINPAEYLTEQDIEGDIRRALRVKDITTWSLRDAHEDLVLQALAKEHPALYLFLLGNPGIGKTTAVSKFLQSHHEDGFFFLYVSPRKQVNFDIIDKFREENNEKLTGETLAITANRDLIRNNQGRQSVQYDSSQLQGKRQYQGLESMVEFIPSAEVAELDKRTHQDRLKARNDREITDDGEQAEGVLKSICNALYVALRDELSNELVATAAIQSLKKTGSGNTTLTHLNTIFAIATGDKGKKVIPEEMRKIAGRIKHLFIMIDEITGDGSGVAFLEGVSKFIKRFRFQEYGINTKVIVADASIVDRSVAERHVDSKKQFEPDKIYFRRLLSKQHALSQESFSYDSSPALAIHSNSYPASRLKINYHVVLDFMQYQEEQLLDFKDRMSEEIQGHLTTEIRKFLAHHDDSQMIIYIQNKKRLSRLIQTIKAKEKVFEENKDYLCIHASIAENTRQHIGTLKKQDSVRVIFMTASASRGLSFSRARRILVDVPRFEVEQNLMEIIQVIYRGRGDLEREKQELELSFYLSDRIVYNKSEERSISIREKILSMTNLLLILKTSIMTRIFGSGTIGSYQYMMIPIGGKSVLAGGESYVGEIEQLIKDLRREYTLKFDQPLKIAYKGLQELLGKGDFSLKPGKETNQSLQTYLSLLPDFNKRFLDAVYSGLANLLHWPQMEPAYIIGNLLLVPVRGKNLESRYLATLKEKLKDAYQGKFYHSLKQIMMQKGTYPDSILSGSRMAVKLIDRVYEANPEKTQTLIQETSNDDQYYALPLLLFLQNGVLHEHFQQESEYLEEFSFRSLLTAYIQTLYPVSSLLPIGDEYEEFPFILFRSYHLREIQQRIFSGSHLLVSHEMNILNMILSSRKKSTQA